MKTGILVCKGMGKVVVKSSAIAQKLLGSKSDKNFEFEGIFFS